jgi:hypothetical protein
LDSIHALDKQAAELEGSAQSAFFGLPSSAKQPENLSTLNQHFGALLSVADSADAAPTAQATAVYHELQKALETLVVQWKKIEQGDVPALNTLLKQSGLLAIDPTKVAAAQPTPAAEGDDEP